jgi:hypothetical protein
VKPGDLVRIIDHNHYQEQHAWVTVGSVSSEKDHRNFPAGTVAVFLGACAVDLDDLPERSLVLIDGTPGWVWKDEIVLYSHSDSCDLVENLPSEGNPV